MDIKLFDVVALRGEFKDLPAPTVPYYVMASDGFFLRKQTTLGEVLLKQKDIPQHYKKSGYEGGVFWYSAEKKIPLHILNLAWGFFRQVYEARHSEAEVLLLLNVDKNIFRIFIPHQVTTGASVESIYDPAELPEGYQVVGSIHSHPGMSAFHSGTDSSDASSFNGLHITMGHIETDKPDLAAMVVVNGSEFHYKDVDMVANITYMKPQKPPKRWISFVGTPEEIRGRTFKSLSETDIEEWISSFRAPRVTIVKGSSGPYHYTSDIPSNFDDDNVWSRWRDGNKKDRKKKHWSDSTYNDDYYTTTHRWSQEIKGYVPKDYLDGASKIKDEFALAAAVPKIEEIADFLLRHNILMKFEFRLLKYREVEKEKTTKSDLIELTDDQEEIEKQSAENDIEDDIKALLPGPFSVLTREQEEIVRQERSEYE